MTWPGGGYPSRLVNRLAGITPVAATWGVDPTLLARCTDDNWANQTGIGNKVVGAWAEVGRLTFDMGAVYNVFFRGKVLIGNNVAGGADCYLLFYGSEDDITYYYAPIHTNYSVVYELYNDNRIIFINCFLRARYVRIMWRSAGTAGTFYGAVNEVQAIDVGL